MLDLEDFTRQLQERQDYVEANLPRFMPSPHDYPPVLYEAMHYAVFNGGKRLRPLLVLEGARLVGGELEPVLPFACAMEMIHSYSLVHDDLPAMDDDDYRRGQPTCHKVFGEANAILAGDALLTRAFEVMAHAEYGRTEARWVVRLYRKQQLLPAVGNDRWSGSGSGSRGQGA